MTSDDLRAWIEGNGLFHQQAADLLAISANQLRKMLYGVRPVDRRTVRIIELMNMPIRVVDSLGARAWLGDDDADTVSAAGLGFLPPKLGRD